MKTYLGIDIGTYESKGVLVDRDGTIVASAARPHKMIVPRPGWAEHRANEDWWEDFVWLSGKLIAGSGIAPSDIKAVGTSGIGPCMLPVDAAGDPLMNAVLYGVDTRALKEVEELTAAIGADTILKRCGNALTSQSVGPKILWLKRNRPDIYNQAHKFLNSTSFLVHRLTGRFVVDHYTASSSGPLYLADENVWTAALAPEVTSVDRLPELAWTTEIAGGVTAGASEQTGLAEGTPVVVGTVDAAAEAVSVGVVEAGDMMLMYGTTIFTILITPERSNDARLWHAPWLFSGQNACMAGLATSGALTHWFREQFARELDPTAAMATLAGEAELSPPGARGLVFLPYFSGERTPIHDPHAKGALFGLNLAHTRADIYRALLEGIAYGTNHVIDAYIEDGQVPRSIYAVGGGVRNPVWTQATSDALGRSQKLSRSSIGASYGDAFLAALAIGDVRRDAITEWNPVVAQVDPEAANAALYRRQYGVFRDLYSRTRDLMERLEG
jgi:xylulokinase